MVNVEGEVAEGTEEFVPGVNARVYSKDEGGVNGRVGCGVKVGIAGLVR